MVGTNVFLHGSDGPAAVEAGLRISCASKTIVYGYMLDRRSTWGRKTNVLNIEVNAVSFAILDEAFTVEQLDIVFFVSVARNIVWYERLIASEANKYSEFSVSGDASLLHSFGCYQILDIAMEYNTV